MTDETRDPFEFMEKGTTWKGRAIYHCTLTVADHACLLGQIVVPREGNTTTACEKATVHRLPLGQAVVDCFFDIPKHHPEIKLFPQKLMPNHFHFIVEVKRKMPCGIRKVLQGFQQGCKAAARRLAQEGRLLEGVIGSDEFVHVFPNVDDIYIQRKTERETLQTSIDDCHLSDVHSPGLYGLPLTVGRIATNSASPSAMSRTMSSARLTA